MVAELGMAAVLRSVVVGGERALSEASARDRRHAHADHITALGDLGGRTGRVSVMGEARTPSRSIRGATTRVGRLRAIGEEKRHYPRLVGKRQAEYVGIMKELNIPNAELMDVAGPANPTPGKVA